MKKTATQVIDAQIASLLASGAVANGDVTTAAGAPGIDLLGALSVVTLKTPWTDRLYRADKDVTGLQAQWYEILASTGRFSGKFWGGAEEGKRGGQIEWSAAVKAANYKKIATDYAVTDEQYYAQKGIMDPRSFGINGALIECKRLHHKYNLFGRTTTVNGVGAGGVGTVGTVTATGSTASGAIPAATYKAVVVPLNGEAAYNTRTYEINSSFAGASDAYAGSELLDYTRTNGGGTTTTVKGGSGIASAAASVTLASTGKVTLSWAPVKGAVAYAVFFGTSDNEVYQGTVFRSTAELTTLKATSGSNYYQSLGTNFTTNRSADAMVYDGILSQLTASDSPAGYTALGNTDTLSSSEDFTLDQLIAPLSTLYRTFDGYGPKRATMGPRTARAVNLALLKNASPSSSTSRATYFLNDGDIEKAIKRPIVNPYSDEMIEQLIDPYFPEGKILLEPVTVPTQISQKVAFPVAFRPVWDFWGEVWPRTQPKVENGVSLRGALITPWRAGFHLVDNVPF